MIRKIFQWIFRAQLTALDNKIKETERVHERLKDYERTLQNVLENIDVSVDVNSHQCAYAPSWAVISLQGKKTDYIKFIDLGDSDLREIERFLRRYERLRKRNIKIDAVPGISDFLRINSKR